MKKLIGLLVVFAVAATMAYAVDTVTSTGQAKATIVSAASISHSNSDYLNFGVIFSNTSGGTVTIANTQEGTRTLSGVSAAAGAHSSDKFSLSSLDVGTTYNLVIPTTTITLTGPSSNTMTVSNLAFDQASFTADAATKDVYVGGQLAVGANQVAGEYTGSYTVNLTY